MKSLVDPNKINNDRIKAYYKKVYYKNDQKIEKSVFMKFPIPTKNHIGYIQFIIHLGWSLGCKTREI